MPNGKPSSGASGTAKFASSAIAFRRIDYWLKPRPECFCEIVPSRAKNDARGCNGGLRQKLAALLQRACRRSDQIKSATEKILRPRSPAAVILLCTTGVVHRRQGVSIRTPRRQTLRRDHASALGRTSPADIPPLRFSPGAAPAPSRRKNLLRPPSF